MPLRGEVYVYHFYRDEVSKFLATLHRHAMNPDLNITLKDAAIASHSIRKVLKCAST